MEGGGARQRILDEAAHQVLRLAALHAEQMMVVFVVAQLVVQIVVLQHHPAQDVRFHQDLENAVDCGPPHVGRELLSQALGREVTVLLRYSEGQGLARPGAPIASPLQRLQDLLGHGRDRSCYRHCSSATQSQIRCYY